MQTSGARARLRSKVVDGRPFFPPARSRLAVFDGEITDIESGSHEGLRDGLLAIQQRQAEQIESAEFWRSQRILNIENEFDCAIKAAVDQYHVQFYVVVAFEPVLIGRAARMRFGYCEIV